MDAASRIILALGNPVFLGRVQNALQLLAALRAIDRREHIPLFQREPATDLAVVSADAVAGNAGDAFP